MSMVYKEAPDVGCIAIVRFGSETDVYTWDGETYIYQFTLQKGGELSFLREHSHAEDISYRVEYIDFKGLEAIASVINAVC